MYFKGVISIHSCHWYLLSVRALVATNASDSHLRLKAKHTCRGGRGTFVVELSALTDKEARMTHPA